MLPSLAVDAPKTTGEIWVPVVAALIALIGVMLTLWQKWQSDRRALRQKTTSDREAVQAKIDADRREAWWARTQWAMDAAIHAKTPLEAAMALAVLKRVGLSDLATQRDGVMLIEVASSIQAKWGSP